MLLVNFSYESVFTILTNYWNSWTLCQMLVNYFPSNHIKAVLASDFNVDANVLMSLSVFEQYSLLTQLKLLALCHLEEACALVSQ